MRERLSTFLTGVGGAMLVLAVASATITDATAEDPDPPPCDFIEGTTDCPIDTAQCPEKEECALTETFVDPNTVVVRCDCFPIADDPPEP